MTSSHPYFRIFLNKSEGKIRLFLSGFSFTNIHDSQDSRRRGRLLLTFPYHFHFYHFTTLRKLRHQPRDYCRKLTSACSQQQDSNREPLVSKRKSLTTKLRSPKKKKKKKLPTQSKAKKISQQYCEHKSSRNII